MDEMINYLLAPVGQVALIIGIAQLIKNIGFPVKFIPLTDLLLGLLSGVVVYGYEFDLGIIKGVMIGLAMGLSACGLFSGIKNTVQKCQKW